MSEAVEFPLDDATLIMLAASCEINEETGRTHLHDFLDMGARVKSSTDITERVFGEEGGLPVYEVEFEDGFAPWSPHDAIRALVTEVLRLRGSSSSRPEHTT